MGNQSSLILLEAFLACQKSRVFLGKCEEKHTFIPPSCQAYEVDWCPHDDMFRVEAHGKILNFKRPAMFTGETSGCGT
jgi:hypothetical protein